MGIVDPCYVKKMGLRIERLVVSRKGYTDYLGNGVNG